jgi:hypothetical protein
MTAGLSGHEYAIAVTADRDKSVPGFQGSVHLRARRPRKSRQVNNDSLIVLYCRHWNL